MRIASIELIRLDVPLAYAYVGAGGARNAIGKLVLRVDTDAGITGLGETIMSSGSIRREILDHVIVLNDAHLQRLLRRYAGYYNGYRTHLGLAKDTPLRRAI